MSSCELSGPGYRLAIHDNEPSDDPPAGEGQNGIRRWRIDSDPDLPLIAKSWLNLEHVITEDRRFSGNREDPGFFEPRQVPVRLEASGDRVRLSHDALPRTGCACWIEYTPGDRPGSLDFRVGFTPTRRVGAGDVIGLFLPCYIHQPESKSIHFVGRRGADGNRRWVEYCSACHHSVLTIPSDRTAHAPPYEASELATFTDFARHSYPFLWGRIGPCGFTLMLDAEEGLETRFWMSPEGGGCDPATHRTNPAWDFTVLAFGYDTDREYTARGRLVLRKMADREDAVEEYEAWSGQTCTWEV